MIASRAVLSLVLLPMALTAQRTWIVDPAGGGDFLSLDAAHAAATSGDTLLLRGTMPAPPAWLTKNLHYVAHNSYVSTAMLIDAPGPLSISGGTFAYLLLNGTTASLDGVSAGIRVQGGSTLAARGCTFPPGTYVTSGAWIEGGARAVFDGCSFRGRDAYAAFGVLLGTPGLLVDGHAELRNCTITGGADFVTGGNTFAGGSAIFLSRMIPGSGSVALRDCTLAGGNTQPLVAGSGSVLAQNTVTQGAVPSPASVTIANALLPWTTGSGAAPGGVLQASVDGPAATLAAVYASLGMRSPVAAPGGDVWIDPAFVVVLAVGVTDAGGALQVSLPVPLQVQRGLQLTVQSALALGGGVVATAPAILQVR